MVAEELRFWINYALSIARDIAIGRNLKLFLQVRYYPLLVFSSVIYGTYVLIIYARLLLDYGLHHLLEVSLIFLRWSISVSFLGPLFLCNQHFQIVLLFFWNNFIHFVNIFFRGSSKSFSSSSV